MFFSIELDLKDTKDTIQFASFLDLRLDNNNESRLKTNMYDKREDYNLQIVKHI